MRRNAYTRQGAQVDRKSADCKRCAFAFHQRLVTRHHQPKDLRLRVHRAGDKQTDRHARDFLGNRDRRVPVIADLYAVLGEYRQSETAPDDAAFAGRERAHPGCNQSQAGLVGNLRRRLLTAVIRHHIANSRKNRQRFRAAGEELAKKHIDFRILETCGLDHLHPAAVGHLIKQDGVHQIRATRRGQAEMRGKVHGVAFTDHRAIVTGETVSRRFA